MRYIVAVSLFLASSLSFANAQNRPATWCATGENGSVCGFISLDQCLATARGDDRACAPDRV
jgi:hypothetical protein